MTQPQASNRWQHDGPEIDPWSAMSSIIAGVLMWGAIGFGISEWLNSRAYMGAGVVVGGVLGVLSVYLRYGRAQSGPPATGGPVVFPGQSGSAQGAVTPAVGPLGPAGSAPTSRTTSLEEGTP